MNLEVGDDDITADKDFKHVFKRCRNLCLRVHGIKLHGVEILPSVLRTHLLDNQVSRVHVDSLLKPEDKQDVKLAYDLLRETWLLPAINDNLRPGFSDTREALRTLGIFFRHILLPYICVDLSLSEQLVHLSTATHILLAMAREEHNRSLSSLMPTQLYIDIMIMIKNVFFCVAKVKADTANTGKFYLILLGTDRLEELFGILQTMVGNDSGLDILQLVLRLGGTTEVSTILAQHPEWDRSPRRLKLPALFKDGLDIHKGVDHIKPATWRGNVSVSSVNLATCWDAGRREVKEIPSLDRVLHVLESADSDSHEINILQPFGKDIVRARPTADDYNDSAEDYEETRQENQLPPPLLTSVEDAVIEEAVSHSYQPFFEIEGKKVWKGRYLSERFKEFKNPGSRDCLKRYAAIPRYALKHESANTDFVIRDQDHKPESSFIRMDFPVASILKCDGRFFVCIGEVNDLVFDSKHVPDILLDQLQDSTTYVSFQLLHLIPATEDDDPTCKTDWHWPLGRGSTYQVPGRLVEPVNPDLSMKTVNKPFYLFESGTLQVIGSLFLERLTREESQQVPVIQATASFPYREVNSWWSILSKSTATIHLVSL